MRKFFAFFALLLTGILMGEVAHAQCPGSPPIGTIYICNFVNGQKVVTLPGGPASTTSTGGAQVRVAGYSTNPCQVIFEVIGFNSQGTGEFGAINTDLVPTPERTTLTGTATSLFPATLDLNLRLRASGSALGTQTYTSQGALNLRATNIRSLPLRNVNVSQGEPVRFVSDNGSQTFTLDKTNVVLNP